VVNRGEGLGEVEVCQQDVLVVRVVSSIQTHAGEGSGTKTAWAKALLFRADDFVGLYVFHC